MQLRLAVLCITFAGQKEVVLDAQRKGEKKRERQKRYDKHKTQTDETLIYGDAFLFQQEAWF